MILPLKTISDSFKSSLETILPKYLDVPTLINNSIKDIILDYYYKYSEFDYNGINLLVNDDTTYATDLCLYLIFKLRKYSLIFNQFSENLYKINSLTANENINSEEKQEYNENNTKTSENDNTSNSYAMNENAPIDADITSITTPSNKGKTNSNNHSDENETNVISKTNTISNDQTKDNPYYYEVYNRLLKDYNIEKIVDNCIICIIHEFAD